MLSRKYLRRLLTVILTALAQGAATTLGTKITDLIICWITRH